MSKPDREAEPKAGKSRAGKFSGFWNRLGPGLITGSSDDDPSGIATYTQAGARFGLATLWTSIITFPLMAGLQEMCARIGLVTSHGLMGVIRRHYPRWISFLVIVLSFPAITLNIGADLAGMGAVSTMLFPSIHPGIFSLGFAVLLVPAVILLSYNRLARVLKWMCLTLLCYLVVPFFADLDWQQVVHGTFLPDVSFSPEFLFILVGILGTTISPYLFFWQASVEVEEKEHRSVIVDKHVLAAVKADINYGMGFSGLVMYFIILSAGAILFPEGVRNIDTVEQAAAALKPLAGRYAYLFFAVGVIGTGLLAIPVLAGSLSYMIAEAFDWKYGMDKKFYEAKGFYLVLIVSVGIALLIHFSGLSAVRSLLYTAVLYGLTAPVLIGLILHICNNRSIMGEYVNGRLANLLGAIALVVMTVCAGALLFY